MAESYDVIIVGGGPAGIFAALELTQVDNLRILLVEKGKGIAERRCPVRDTGGSWPVIPRRRRRDGLLPAGHGSVSLGPV